MSDESATLIIPSGDPRAIELVLAVRGGATDAIRRLLSEHPGLASARLGSQDDGTGTPLHVVTDWPGYFPRGPQIARLLIDAGADPNALTTGRGEDPRAATASAGAETPLHYAASSDDADVARELIDGGADLETPGGSIGTPLDNAIGYGCWHVARLLVARGAGVGKLWHAAALGMLERLDELLQQPGTSQDQISQAFWHACAGGQRRAAERLLHAGAELNWVPDYADGTPLDTAAGLGTQQQNVIEWLQSNGAQSARSDSPG
ncbi:MAG: ankyrin repeat domain-containing protein [Streptosporangiaceae bacterium]|jgi:ankyrin repeat protein